MNSLGTALMMKSTGDCTDDELTDERSGDCTDDEDLRTQVRTHIAAPTKKRLVDFLSHMEIMQPSVHKWLQGGGDVNVYMEVK